MDPLKRIVELLEDDSPRKRIAAAVVLGELKVKDAGVIARLCEMARDPVDGYAEAAVEALGALGAMKGLPVLLEARSAERASQPLASKAIAALGEEALPETQRALERCHARDARRRAVAVAAFGRGGRASFEMALEGMRGQPWDNINKVALSVRAEARAGSEADRKVMRTQVEKFLDKKKVQEDETALRGGIKVLGYLETPR